MGTFAVGQRNAMLDDFLETEVWVKLHKGSPGAAGTENAATETTRKKATMSAASEGASANTAALEWTEVSTTEEYTHISLWTAEAAGTFRGSDELSSKAAVTEGDTFKIPVGSLDLEVL